MRGSHKSGDGLTSDSLFVELAYEYMEHVAFIGDQRDTTRHENRRLIEKKVAPLMGALALRGRSSGSAKWGRRGEWTLTAT